MPGSASPPWLPPGAATWAITAGEAAAEAELARDESAACQAGLSICGALKASLQSTLTECYTRVSSRTAQLVEASNKLVDMQLANDTNAGALSECQGLLADCEAQRAAA